MAKEYLRHIKTLDQRVKNKKLEVEKLFSLSSGLKGISYEKKEGVNNTPNDKSPQETYIYKLLEYQDELKKDIDELVEYRQEAMHLIDQINDANCIDVLYKRYFEYKKWEEIALEMNYAYRSIIRLHGEALHKMDKIIGLNCG